MIIERTPISKEELNSFPKSQDYLFYTNCDDTLTLINEFYEYRFNTIVSGHGDTHELS